MATTGDGFRVTIGIVLAILFIVFGVPVLMCGGCATLFIGGGAVQQAQEAAERAKQKQEQAQQRQLEQVAAQPDAPNLFAEPVAKPEAATTEQPAAVIDWTPKKPEKPESPTDVKPQEVDQAAEQEKAAAAKLKLAKGLIGKSPDAANKRLKEILEKFPGTEAAAEAQKLLDK